MIIEYNDYIFSDMFWLDEVISECDHATGGKGKYARAIDNPYYLGLLKIREIQNSGHIPSNEIYKSIYCKIGGSVESGYYNANIHYELFRTDVDKERLEKRILWFIDHAEDKYYLNEVFRLNFINNFVYYLKNNGYHFLENVIKKDDLSFLIQITELINKYGTELEKEILYSYTKKMEEILTVK